MKILYFALFFLLTFSVTQSQWTQQNSGTTYSFNSVFFSDANNGWVVGYDGPILSTTNGGTTWTQQSSGTTNSLRSVFFSDANNGWVFGDAGTILRTTNGGINWTSQTSGTTNRLLGASFIDANNGWVVGEAGIILRTTNTGTSWTAQTSGTTNWLWGVQFTDANNGWAVGDGGKILRTTNGGTSWSSQSSGTTNVLRSVCFTDANNGWTVGHSGTIIRTTNGGASWTSQSSGTSQNIYGVSFTNINNGTVVGEAGTILTTTNTGTNWMSQSSGTTNALPGLFFLDANNGWAVGDNGVIIKYSAQSLEQFTEQTSISLTGVDFGSVDWGDYDNDGYVDILLTGRGISKVYRNNGNNSFTEQTSIALFAITEGSAAWGDYDNDGYLDILLTGSGISKIYRNNRNNSFIEMTSIILFGVSRSSVAWGDYDNDGDLDILLNGIEGNWFTKIYRNDGTNIFTEITTMTLPGSYSGSVVWGDYDNDGDLDILLTGAGISKIYRNESNDTFIEQTSISLPNLIHSRAKWGDFNNDSYLDFIITGEVTSGNNISKIYKNNGNNSFTEMTSFSIIGIENGSPIWGDYNNDGNLDLLISGETSSGGRISRIYKNNGNETFSEVTTSLNDVRFSGAAWGDYDNDGDLDILLTGSSVSGLVSKIYRNNNPVSNSVPTAPTNLSSTVNGQDVTFSWNKSTDNETPQNGLNYNLVIGTTPNSTNLLSPMSDRTTGFRKVVRLGNSQINSWTIKGLANQTYYWSVQAIDNNFAGSPFATEQSFVVGQQSPHFTLIWSSNPYTPMNIYVTSATIGGAALVAGDEIGLFDGANCVGSVVLTEPIPSGGYVSIIASTDDPTTTPIDGFVPGHSITYKLWDASNSREITNVTPTYTLGNGTFSSQGTAVVSLTSIYTVTQQVPQSTGWNILSLMATPDNPNMLQLLNPLITAGTLIKVQDERGFAVEQLPVIGWINNIGNWQATEGYYMRVNGPSTLSVEGVPVALPLNIPLTNGWNIIGYPVPTDQNALTVLNPLITANQLIKVQNEAGQAVEQLPVIGWINNIGNFRSGEGYYLRVNANTSLTLSDPGDSPVKVLAVNEEEKKTNLNKPNADHFVPIYTSPYLPMNIYVTAVDLVGGGSLAAGDDIGIFDGNYCVGAVTLTEPISSFVSIIASTDDPSAPGIDGFTPGHTISYRFWLASTQTEITTYNVEYTLGDGTFASQGTALVSFESVLPVELTSFTAALNKNEVKLKWGTATETNNYGFEIERKTDDTWQKIGFVEGNGNSSSPKEYSFTDNKLVGGTKFLYRLKQIDSDGKYEYSTVVEVENIPTEYALYQNYPNPFNPTTKIRYQLPKESKVIIKIYNILGSEVLELLNENKEPGIYEAEFNASNLSSGTYIYKISADNFVETKKMILMK